MKNRCSKFETFPKPCYLLYHYGNDVILVIPENLFSGRVHLRTLIVRVYEIYCLISKYSLSKFLKDLVMLVTIHLLVVFVKINII